MWLWVQSVFHLTLDFNLTWLAFIGTLCNDHTNLITLIIRRPTQTQSPHELWLSAPGCISSSLDEGTEANWPLWTFRLIASPLSHFTLLLFSAPSAILNVWNPFRSSTLTGVCVYVCRTFCLFKFLRWDFDEWERLFGVCISVCLGWIVGVCWVNNSGTEFGTEAWHLSVILWILNPVLNSTLHKHWANLSCL